jgi:hypothetical protein
LYLRNASLIEYDKYDKDNGGFRKGEIGKKAEGLKTLHANLANKIAFIAMDGPGPEGHAVGMHRLDGLPGKTVFFDPNYGHFVFPKSEAFDEWVEFWYNTAIDYTEDYDEFNAKVFLRVKMVGDLLASAFQQRGGTRQNRRGVNLTGTPGTGPSNG